MILAAIILLFAVLVFGTIMVFFASKEPPHARGCDCLKCCERLTRRRIGKDSW